MWMIQTSLDRRLVPSIGGNLQDDFAQAEFLVPCQVNPRRAPLTELRDDEKSTKVFSRFRIPWLDERWRIDRLTDSLVNQKLFFKRVRPSLVTLAKFQGVGPLMVFLKKTELFVSQTENFLLVGGEFGIGLKILGGGGAVAAGEPRVHIRLEPGDEAVYCVFG